MVMLESGLSLATNVKIFGSGERTLVLSHGFGGDQSIWDKILPHLVAEKYRIVVFDWNFSGQAGDSTLFDSSLFSSFDPFAQDLISLLDDLDLKRLIFVGHSMSGMIGCIASIKRPDLFQRLILLGASPCYLNSEDYKGGFERSDIDDILSNLELDFPSWALSFAALVVNKNDPPSVDKFGKSLQRMRGDVALSLAKTIFLSDHRDVLERVEVPCSILQTTNDPVVPLSVSYYMQKKMMKVKASVETIEEDGHFPQLTAYELFIDVLDKVLIGF